MTDFFVPATLVAVCAVMAGCATSTTTTTLTPSPQSPVCDAAGSALVLWTAQWRADQKDVPERTAAAHAGLQAFFASSGCFAKSELRRLPSVAPAVIAAEVASVNGQYGKIVTIALRELGPTVKLLSSAALIDGTTEARFQVVEYTMPWPYHRREFTVHWQEGGPGVIKGVASLPQDLQAALVAGLQTGARSH